ncbi:MAG TPA: hypothetical protein PKK56_02230 [archaeon]|jgi:hypothetical protein|nr:hypothetical protein [archaeon]HPC10183.1 hypothetical protein [archaeon]HRT02423.1 hypothetical protein [Candidatus Diapherotrites archaeon]
MISNIFLATALEDTLWWVLVIAFAAIVYGWAKGKMGNKTVAVILVIFLVIFVFLRFTELVWLIAIGVVIWVLFGDVIKKEIKSW